MKHFITATALMAVIACNNHAQEKGQFHGYPVTPVPFTSVKVDNDSFWGQRLQASREVTIPLAFSNCEKSGRYQNFINAAHPSDLWQVGGKPFDDTDVYKVIEGASYLLQTYSDKQMVHYIDSVIDIVKAAQEPDGYLYTARTQNPRHPHRQAGIQRWEKVEERSHEFYNLGHMIEGAIAHYQATGKRNFLDIAIRYADCVCREIGDKPKQLVRVPGHQIAEMALAKLYLVTGDKKYLDQAKFFLDYRGRSSFRDKYSQSHLLVTEQAEAVGHAVRASYMYAGMADVAALTGDTAYIHAIDRIWDNIVTKKLYITGGIGSTAKGESFGADYELPNMAAYCETCAAIGNVYVNYRLFLLHGESKYYDVLERTLYNGLLSGVSLDGASFFYPNPLESCGQHQRQAWFGCACCPSNICRFIPSLPGYVYAVKDRILYVNLFMTNTSNMKIEGKNVSIRQETCYPWNGDINLEIKKNRAGQFTLRLRIPEWVQNRPVPSNLYKYNDGKQSRYSVRVNDKIVNGELKDGYFCIERNWKKGDVVNLHFDMEPRVVEANAKVEADRGCIAIERGPLVYCAEWPDNEGVDLSALLVNPKERFEVLEKPELLRGINAIQTTAQQLSYDEQGMLTLKDVRLTLIPYYAWAHRGAGSMMVWLPQDVSASNPLRPSRLANSRIEASVPTGSISAINDGLIPKDGDDRSVPNYNWIPKTGTTEWVSYEFPEEVTLSSSTVYWFDDAPWGDCRVPKNWKVYYRNANGQWRPVKTSGSYETEKGKENRIGFVPVKTRAVKLEVTMQEGNSAGISEWTVK